LILKKNKYGGYLENATYKGNEKLYDVWRAMLNRCCDKNHVRHDAYKNVTVCAEWFCFENFLKEVKEIEGWNETSFFNGEIQLDKDYKQIDAKEKVYSKNTCIWISKEMNNSYQPNRCKPFIMTKPDGTEYVYYSQHLCAREHGLNVININQCLKGAKKTHKNNKFKYC
jgi:hypothetical protein